MEGEGDTRRIPLRELPKAARVDIHISTLFRWAERGVKGRDGQRHRLRTTRIGGRVYATMADFEDFNRRLNAESGETPETPAAVSARREAEIDAAEDELRRMGV